MDTRKHFGRNWRLGALVLSCCLCAASTAHAVEPPVPPAKPDSGKPATPPEKKPAPRPWASGLNLSDGEHRVSLFGITGEGSRYLFVFDRSGSMGEDKGRPLAAAKSELIKSLAGITSVQQFQVVFYNERPQIIGGGQGTPRFLFGDDRGRRDAEEFVRGIAADGGSGHIDALMLALSLGPDVIFFLTDGGEPELGEADFTRLHTRNERVGAKIHTIEFGAGPATAGRSFVKRLADENNGKYVYVDTTQLPRP